MFDNLLNQNVEELLISDIVHNNLPNSLLFSGPVSSGKFTCALELARVLSCRAAVKGEWTCTCSSCLKHKALVSNDLIIAGPKDTTLEIAAARKTLLSAAYNNASYLPAVRYLFVRAVRKLTARFNPVLWQNDDKIGKISGFTSVIDEILEELDPLRPMLPIEQLEKLSETLLDKCIKLESGYMYDSLPISQMRNISTWARYTISEGKKLVVLENADRMLESVRNAVLKILEEPPEGTIFVLTTARRSAIIPTILSRVRTYNFVERTPEQKQDVVKRLFHVEASSVDEYLNEFLPVEPKVIQDCAMTFWNKLTTGKNVDVAGMVKECGNFDPRVLLRVFFNTLFQYQRRFLSGIQNAPAQSGTTERLAYISNAIREAYENITIYNQSPVASLENLATKFLR